MKTISTIFMVSILTFLSCSQKTSIVSSNDISSIDRFKIKDYDFSDSVALINCYYFKDNFPSCKINCSDTLILFKGLSPYYYQSSERCIMVEAFNGKEMAIDFMDLYLSYISQFYPSNYTSFAGKRKFRGEKLFKRLIEVVKTLVGCEGDKINNFMPAIDLVKAIREINGMTPSEWLKYDAKERFFNTEESKLIDFKNECGSDGLMIAAQLQYAWDNSLIILKNFGED